MKGQKIHMVGIGGIGMSALAQYYRSQGADVTGSDREVSPTTKMLEEKGITVLIGQQADNVPEDATMLVYSAAIQGENPERIRGRELGISELVYPEALGKVTEGKRLIAVVGTHGKTTTTAMIGKILEDAGKDPTVIVGSIVPQWHSNFRAGSSDIFVVEACEYRRHFLAFHPDVLVVTNIEWDHTDFYKTAKEFEAAFDEIKQQSQTVIDSPIYGTVSAPELKLPGEFNKENARAAKAGVKALCPDISDSVIDESLSSFRGTWRRFEHKGTLPEGAELYDDYAHHPTSIEKTIGAAREKFPDKKIVVFFHPHLYSRTRDLFDGFAESLAKADQTYILPVYAAREPFDPSATHDALAEAANKKGGNAKGVNGFEETTELLKTLGSDTIAFTMGAGDIYKAGEEALK
ncbi:UDP-N-acetylmuramate--L-alanine ligase [Patescibacteria group bacterium]|nr:UDP-N-acetylmuramate--L-alanine ligase [Patescibacteria group bacterium]